MALVAQANGANLVLSVTGIALQSKVFVEGILAATKGDMVGIHTQPGCGIDTQTLSIVSTKVFVSGNGIGRIGDYYGDNVITSSCTKVNAG